MTELDTTQTVTTDPPMTRVDPSTINNIVSRERSTENGFESTFDKNFSFLNMGMEVKDGDVSVGTTDTIQIISDIPVHDAQPNQQQEPIQQQQQVQQQPVQQQTVQQTPEPTVTPTPDPIVTPDVEALNNELALYKETKEFMATEEYISAKIVAEEMKADPVGFVKNYMPQVWDALAKEQRLDAIYRTSETPRDYAIGYSEQALLEKYGSEFVVDPNEALFAGTQSYNYVMDRNLFVQEGFNSYHQNIAQQQMQQQQQQQQALVVAQKVAQKYGVDPLRVQEVFDKETIAPENQLENYYEMLFGHFDKLGKLTNYKVAGANTQPVVQRVPTPQVQNPNLPPASAASIPASQQPDNRGNTEGWNDFAPSDYLAEAANNRRR
jgi:hypothetical protein